jgi:hypothetical protein
VWKNCDYFDGNLLGPRIVNAFPKKDFPMKNRLWVSVATAIGLLASSTYYLVEAQGRPPMRVHTATKAAPLTLQTAKFSISGATYNWSINGTRRVLTGNGLPTHMVGAFPNPGNPNDIAKQNVNLSVTTLPKTASKITSAEGWVFGVSINGIVFDPFAAEFWQGNRRSGWNYDALGGAVALGLDANYAHVQPQGTYHYHGIPFGLLELLRYDASKHSPLVGYAADGYPIYALTGIANGQVKKMTSSYRLKPGNRPGGDAPDGAYDGAFVQDYDYVPGLGTLDECNGAMTVSAEYPSGTYAYFITEAYPVVPRCFTGTPDRGFSHRG